MTPGAHPHANIAVGADLPPIVETRLRIQFPSHRAVELELITIRNRIGGTTARAFFAKAAKILDTDTNRGFVFATPTTPAPR